MIESERLAPEQFDTLPGILEPAENPDLYGHRSEADALARAYCAGRLHHALLLIGPHGIGKATLAFATARCLLGNPDGAPALDGLSRPDPTSSVFRQVASGAHPGLLHLSRPFDRDGKKFKTTITVDEVRRISKFLAMTSHDGGYRIVIVDPADDMNANAANALLKNLEEPPSKTLFILVSHAPGRLLPTIRSRCRSTRLHPLAKEDLFSVLEALGETIPAEAGDRENLVKLAAGSPRNALLLTHYGGMELTSALDELLTGTNLDIGRAYKLAEAVSAREADIQFSIVNEAILDRIAEKARTAGLEGDAVASSKLSSFWQEASESISKTSTFNLDKKQHVIGLITRLRAYIGQ